MFVGVGLFFIGLPSPVLWGLLAALLRFIPYVGSITAAVLPIALAAAVDPGWSIALWTAGLFIVAEGVTGQFLEPVLYGSSTGLSPTAVIVVAIFWSWIWGPIGLILSTPLTLCLVVLGRHVRHLEFFDVLLGDRPALTPVEGLYQRLLAGDPDEILEQAETLLKGRALSSYYDDIALKALRLVASDISRGVVEDAQLEKIQEEMLGLIQDLEPHDDLDPVLTDKQAKAAVVEVAGVARRNARLPPNRRRKNMSTRTRISPKSGARNEACFASQGAAPSTASRRRCWRSCCASMGSARKRRRVTRRPGRGSARSTPPASQWCASPTSSSSAARRICATFCAESNNDFRSPRS